MIHHFENSKCRMQNTEMKYEQNKNERNEEVHEEQTHRTAHIHTKTVSKMLLLLHIHSENFSKLICISEETYIKEKISTKLNANTMEMAR